MVTDYLEMYGLDQYLKRCGHASRHDQLARARRKTQQFNWIGYSCGGARHFVGSPLHPQKLVKSLQAPGCEAVPITSLNYLGPIHRCG